GRVAEPLLDGEEQQEVTFRNEPAADRHARAERRHRTAEEDERYSRERCAEREARGPRPRIAGLELHAVRIEDRRQACSGLSTGMRCVCGTKARSAPGTPYSYGPW